MASANGSLKSSWRRRERWRRWANLGGVAGALIAALLVGLVIFDDISLGQKLGLEMVLIGIAMVVLGFVLPRYAVLARMRSRSHDDRYS